MIHNVYCDNCTASSAKTLLFQTSGKPLKPLVAQKLQKYY